MSWQPCAKGPKQKRAPLEQHPLSLGRAIPGRRRVRGAGRRIEA